MNKSTLLTTLSTARQLLTATFAGLPDELLVQPGAEGDWSVKDILAHVAAWEAELITLLVREVKRGQKPKLYGLPDAGVEKLNQQWYQENKDRPLERVLADFHGARKQLIRQINDWNESDLTSANKYQWLEGKSLAEYIIGFAAEHEDDHRVALEVWRKQLNQQ
jgi:hypothetical protein